MRMKAQEHVAETRGVRTSVRTIHKAFGKLLDADMFRPADQRIWKRLQSAIGIVAHVNGLPALLPVRVTVRRTPGIFVVQGCWQSGVFRPGRATGGRRRRSPGTTAASRDQSSSSGPPLRLGPIHHTKVPAMKACATRLIPQGQEPVHQGFPDFVVGFFLTSRMPIL